MKFFESPLFYLMVVLFGAIIVIVAFYLSGILKFGGPRSISSDGMQTKDYALYEAVGNKDSKKVKKLLEDDANPNYRLYSDETASPVIFIAISNQDYDTLKLLVEADADVNYVDRAGNTPLTYTITKNFPFNDGTPKNPLLGEDLTYKFAELLIQNGADVNLAGKNAMPPLLAASAAGFKDVTELLIKKGAKIDRTDFLGDNALHKAVDYYGETKESSEGGAFKTMEFLIQNGADVNQQNTFGMTPLMLISNKLPNSEYIKMAKLLLINGATLDKKSKDGLTAMDYAKKTNNAKLIALFDEFN